MAGSRCAGSLADRFRMWPSHGETAMGHGVNPRTARPCRSVLITFLVPGAKHPIGGAIAMYEFANGMSRRGHEVQVVHIDFIGNSREQVYRFPDRVETLDDIDGFTFEERIEHHFPRSFDETELPDADFVFFIDDRVPTRSGLPVILVQGYGLLTQEFEHQLYRAPCPKVCVAKWLVDVGKQLGV